MKRSLLRVLLYRLVDQESRRRLVHSSDHSPPGPLAQRGGHRWDAQRVRGFAPRIAPWMGSVGAWHIAKATRRAAGVTLPQPAAAPRGSCCGAGKWSPLGVPRRRSAPADRALGNLEGEGGCPRREASLRQATPPGGAISVVAIPVAKYLSRTRQKVRAGRTPAYG